MLRHPERGEAVAFSAAFEEPLGPRGGPNPLMLGAPK